MDKNSFDAALRPRVRAALAPSNSALRRLLDDSGQFLPGVSFARDCPYCHTASATASLVLQA